MCTSFLDTEVALFVFCPNKQVRQATPYPTVHVFKADGLDDCADAYTQMLHEAHTCTLLAHLATILEQAFKLGNLGLPRGSNCSGLRHDSSLLRDLGL